MLPLRPIAAHEVGSLPRLPHIPWTILTRAVVVVVLLVGVWSSTTALPQTADFRPGTYVATEIRHDRVPVEVLAATSIRVTYNSHALEAWAGCQRIWGTAEVSGGRLRVLGEGLVMGILLCSSDGTARGGAAEYDQATWLRAFLESRPVIIAVGETLQLDSGTTEIRFVRQP